MNKTKSIRCIQTAVFTVNTTCFIINSDHKEKLHNGKGKLLMRKYFIPQLKCVCVWFWLLTHPTVKYCLISCRRFLIMALYSPILSFFPSTRQVRLGRGLYL